MDTCCSCRHGHVDFTDNLTCPGDGLPRYHVFGFSKPDSAVSGNNRLCLAEHQAGQEDLPLQRLGGGAEELRSQNE